MKMHRYMLSAALLAIGLALMGCAPAPAGHASGFATLETADTPLPMVDLNVNLTALKAIDPVVLRKVLGAEQVTVVQSAVNMTTRVSYATGDPQRWTTYTLPDGTLVTYVNENPDPSTMPGFNCADHCSYTIRPPTGAQSSA